MIAMSTASGGRVVASPSSQVTVVGKGLGSGDVERRDCRIHGQTSTPLGPGDRRTAGAAADIQQGADLELVDQPTVDIEIPYGPHSSVS